MKDKKNKTSKILLSSIMVFAMAFTFMPTNVLAMDNNPNNASVASPRAGEVAIDETNFPDPAFKTYVSTNIDTDGNNSLSQSEMDAVTSIMIVESPVTSLTGIAFFPNLMSLNCKNSHLTSLDVSKNLALKYLFCSSDSGTNQIKSLDLTKNTILESLGFASNLLTSLDVSNNPKLESLDCSYNQLTNLDVTKNTALTNLSCTRNQLTSLDVSNNTSLFGLNCSENQLTSLDVTTNTALMNFDCSLQASTITYDKNKGYKLNAYDTGFDKSKGSNFAGATLEGDGTLTGVTSGTPITYNYDTGHAGSPMDVTLNFTNIPDPDKDKLAEAKPLAEKAITDITATNDTTAGNILDAVTTGISSVGGVTVSWKSGSPIITPATKDKAGSITGTIVLTSGSKTIEIAANKVINQLSDNDDKLAKVRALVETAIKDMKVSNTTTAKDFLDTVKNSITSITGVTASWKSGSPIITKATNDKDGSITGTIVLTSDSKTLEITVNKVINKLSSKSNSPQTGDTSNTMLYFGMIILSGCIAGYGLKKKKSLRR
ncbi:MAG: LPXTG cell wall anchor domain-containing protein [Lachnospiraceae bacterium]